MWFLKWKNNFKKINICILSVYFVKLSMLCKVNKKIYYLGKIIICFILIINRMIVMVYILRINNILIFEVKLVYKFC